MGDRFSHRGDRSGLPAVSFGFLRDKEPTGEDYFVAVSRTWLAHFYWRVKRFKLEALEAHAESAVTVAVGEEELSVSITADFGLQSYAEDEPEYDPPIGERDKCLAEFRGQSRMPLARPSDQAYVDWLANETPPVYGETDLNSEGEVEAIGGTIGGTPIPPSGLRAAIFIGRLTSFDLRRHEDPDMLWAYLRYPLNFASGAIYDPLATDEYDNQIAIVHPATPESLWAPDDPEDPIYSSERSAPELCGGLTVILPGFDDVVFGLYSAIVHEVVGTPASYPHLATHVMTIEVSITPQEWWPYAKPDGDPLFATETGLPL